MSANHRGLFVWGGVVTSFALIVIVTVAVFWVPRSTVLDGVRVQTDTDPMRCSGTEVTNSMDGSPDDPFADHGFFVPVADLRPEMDCRLRFFVHNTTQYDVVLDEIVIPLLGPLGGAGAEATMLNPTVTPGRWLPSGEVDAEFTIGAEIPAGVERYFEAVIEFRDDGCSSLRITTSLRAGMWPIATVRFRGMDLDLDSATASFGFGGTQFSDCHSASSPFAAEPALPF